VRAATLFVVVLSSFLVPFMLAALNVALPAMGTQFAMDAVALGWVVTAFILAAAVCMLPAGRIADLYGRKEVFLWGMLVYTLGSLFSAIAPSVGVLMASRIVNGAGAAMVFATGTAMLMSAVAPAERGQALGWNVAAVYLGLALGPFLGGIIAHDLGWRWIFGINALAGAFATVFTLWKLKGAKAEARGERFDTAGSLIYAVALVALMYGLSRLPRAEGAGLAVAGAFGLVLFARWEFRCASPVFDIAIFRRNSVFTYSCLAALINYAATAAGGFLLSLYLQYARHLSPQQAGLVLLAQPVVMALCSPVAGRLSDRIEPGKLASLGMALNVIGLAALCGLGARTPLGLVIADLGLLGLGFGLFSSPNTNAIMSSVAPKFYGIASSTVATMRLIGQMLSMAIVMVIITRFVGHVQINAANVGLFLQSSRVAFAVFAGLCVLGVCASAVRGQVRPRDLRSPTDTAGV
jgi:EmrB/QacA subfamily drug resistance transporter